ncbi:hypothetical protein Tco_1549667 [Tanacetum coccineum]
MLPEPPPNIGQRWPTVAVIDGQRLRTTGQPSPNHQSSTGQRWRSTGQRVLRGSATSAGGDSLSGVSSDVAPCGDGVEIAKKAMARFETMTSRSYS